MNLRRLTKHVQDQNWFAVGLDFVIVVAGILLAFQSTNWSDAHQQKRDTQLAVAAIEADLIYLLWISSEQVASELCRVEQITNVRDVLIRERSKDELVSLKILREPGNEGVNFALSQPFRMTNRSWAVESWQAALATGAAANLSPKQFSLFSAVFNNAEEANELLSEQVRMIGRFGDLVVPGVITPQERRQILSRLSEYDAVSTQVGTRAQGVRRMLSSYTFTSPDRFVQLPSDRAILLATPETVPAVYRNCVNLSVFEPVWAQYDILEGSK
jgi:hypothetical protein